MFGLHSMVQPPMPRFDLIVRSVRQAKNTEFSLFKRSSVKSIIRLVFASTLAQRLTPLANHLHNHFECC